MREPQVHCDNCEKWINVDTTEFENIEEGLYGQDVMTFICPICKKKSKSDVRV
jgi:hypothetical protein